jgi:hypothetical protein
MLNLRGRKGERVTGGGKGRGREGGEGEEGRDRDRLGRIQRGRVRVRTFYHPPK